MCKSSLAAIFGLLPKDRQQEAILDFLEKMLARGEWPGLLSITAELGKLPLDAACRARALYLEMRCALRLQKRERALGACEQLLDLGSAGGGAALACEAICQLAMQWLPAGADMIYALWRRLAGAALPEAGQARLAQAGQMLVRCLAQNGDDRRRAELCSLLEALATARPRPVGIRTAPSWPCVDAPAAGT